MKYVVKKTAMYGSSTYGPYSSYQEALEALEELENNTFSECFFFVENLRSEELRSKNKYPVTVLRAREAIFQHFLGDRLGDIK